MERLVQLDRRWVFLVLGIAVAIPVILRTRFPEQPTAPVQAVFDKIESLPEGSRVLIAFDYEPGNAPELQPMATAWVWHCARKHLRLYVVSLWPLGPQLADSTLNAVLKSDFLDFKYGVDYVQLGYKPGLETVIKAIALNFKGLFTTDARKTPISDIPMMRDVTSVDDMDLILSLSAGAPGTKEWIQYAATPLDVPLASGCTGVQAPLLYPYYPRQMLGLLGAIKGAAEYEAALLKKYPQYGEKNGQARPEFTQGIQRMGPQLVAHVVILVLIILGNVALVLSRRAPGVGR